jgi:hypothetical protein
MGATLQVFRQWFEQWVVTRDPRAYRTSTVCFEIAREREEVSPVDMADFELQRVRFEHAMNVRKQ